MYTSDIDSRAGKARKTFLVYLSATLFCALFGTVYEHFSHGVYSFYMAFLFLFPLAGGMIPFGVFAAFRSLRFPGRLSLNLYHSGIAALTVGSCLKGVLDIYGTASDYIQVYWIAGAALTAAGTLICLAGRKSV